MSEVKKETAKKESATRVFVPKDKAAADAKAVAPKQKFVASTEKAVEIQKTVPVAKVVAAPVKKVGGKIKQNGTPATGRRKESIARVRLVSGSGKIVINGRPMNEYFSNGFSQLIVFSTYVNPDEFDSFAVACPIAGRGGQKLR